MLKSTSRWLGALAVAASMVATAAVAQDAPLTTADIVSMGSGQFAAGPNPNSTAAAMAPILAPIQQLQSSLGGVSTTTISQVGTTNFANSGIVGSGSLSMIAQSGSNNRAVQAIEGNNSAMLLVQSGSDNNVLQASRGNDNTQILGVNGNGNDVAYLQVGDQLAGAMNVSGSNSAVFALQTPGSGRYMMPSGLSGLDNKVVIVVPGRMYVFNR